ncbi:uncharacterized protein LOC131596820 [Vicia villosa]|uniref:uncharacterized protein LOC131596820 n=1 Tax=Vicia villosa TaxID=3911 RepID=UPI00273CD0BE|nr:uncharacterized protein LOC131596820 [Vicia villosa]
MAEGEPLPRGPCVNSPRRNVQFARNARNSEMKTGILQILYSTPFASLDHEDPYTPLTKFYEIAGAVGAPEKEEEQVFQRLFPHSLIGKDKDWYLDQPTQTMTNWNDLEEKFLERFFPQSRFFDAKTAISVFSQGVNESLNEAWERYKSMLRNCPTHGFDDRTQIHIFRNGLQPQPKLLLDATAGGSFMAKTSEEAIEIIEKMARNDHQVQHNRGVVQKKPRLIELGTNDVILAKNKLLSQQVEELTKQMARLPQQLKEMQDRNKNNQVALCELCSGDHLIGYIPPNFETQVGQLANQLAEKQTGPSFTANTQTNPKEHCKAVVARSGRVLESEVRKEVEKEEVSIEKEKEVEKALEQMPKYAKFMKDVLTKKRSYTEPETVILDAKCSAIIQCTLPRKERDPGRVTFSVTIDDIHVGIGLIDLGSSINLIPLSKVKRLGIIDMKDTRMTLQLADKSTTRPYGIAEDLLVKVDKFLFPIDFVVIDMEEDNDTPLILGIPFMKTTRMMIDIDDGLMKLRFQDEEVCFNLFER